jgi:hypothetical protein
MTLPFWHVETGRWLISISRDGLTCRDKTDEIFSKSVDTSDLQASRDKMYFQYILTFPVNMIFFVGDNI